MRRSLAILALPLLALGCATQRATEPDLVYIGSPNAVAPAPALVFSPPVTQYAPPELPNYLDRDARQASAYVGYESSSTVGVVTFDDRQYYSDAYNGAGRGYGRYGSGSLGYTNRQAYQQTAIVRQR